MPVLGRYPYHQLLAFLEAIAHELSELVVANP